MQTLVKLASIAFVLAVWVVPPALAKLKLPYSRKRAASLSALITGFVILVAAGWLRYGWGSDMLAMFLGASVYCGTVLLFTLGFLQRV